MVKYYWCNYVKYDRPTIRRYTVISITVILNRFQTQVPTLYCLWPQYRFPCFWGAKILTLYCFSHTFIKRATSFDILMNCFKHWRYIICTKKSLITEERKKPRSNCSLLRYLNRLWDNLVGLQLPFCVTVS